MLPCTYFPLLQYHCFLEISSNQHKLKIIIYSVYTHLIVKYVVRRLTSKGSSNKTDTSAS